MKMEAIYVRIAALVLSIFSALVLRADIALREFFISIFSMIFNVLFLAEFAGVAFFGRSVAVMVFERLRSSAEHIFNVLVSLNILTALVFLFWALSFPLRTYAMGDVVITLIQGFFLVALCVALVVNYKFYHENNTVRFQNLLQITAVNYAVSVFMAARLLQGSIIMPWQLLAYAMANIVLAVLAMVVMNSAERPADS